MPLATLRFHSTTTPAQDGRVHALLLAANGGVHDSLPSTGDDGANCLWSSGL